MPVNQPPISEDIVVASWQFELTQLINQLEQQLADAQEQITALQTRVTALETP